MMVWKVDDMQMALAVRDQFGPAMIIECFSDRSGRRPCSGASVERSNTYEEPTVFGIEPRYVSLFADGDDLIRRSVSSRTSTAMFGKREPFRP